MDYNLPSEQQALYKLAISCALCRIDNKCSCAFNSKACSKDCKYNILRYIDADPRKAELFMSSAEDQAWSLRRANQKAEKYLHAVNFVFVLALLVVAFVLFACIMGVRDAYKGKQIKPKPAQTVFNTDTVENKVDRALSKVAANYKDVNGDGLVNCIDAAVLFYQYYPNKNEVTIELNYNTYTGLNHLFNVVNFNGTWRAIEPQGKINNHKSYFMRDIWGSVYDSAYNKVVTKDYIKYVKN